jgi:hypothetical protein
MEYSLLTENILHLPPEIYRVIHKSLWDFRPLLYSNWDGHTEGEHFNVENLSKLFCLLGAMVYLQVSPLGGSRDKTWRGQGIRKRSVSWNLSELSQL